MAYNKHDHFNWMTNYMQQSRENSIITKSRYILTEALRDHAETCLDPQEYNKCQDLIVALVDCTELKNFYEDEIMFIDSILQKYLKELAKTLAIGEEVEKYLTDEINKGHFQ
jgi:hypothetical protein